MFALLCTHVESVAIEDDGSRPMKNIPTLEIFSMERGICAIAINVLSKPLLVNNGTNFTTELYCHRF